MAQIVVDSGVMRDKSKTIANEATTIQTRYQEMLQEVNSIANKMRGTTIETAQKQFAGMKPTFETIVEDMKKYSTFLSDAADAYDKAERDGTQKAEQQGKVF